LGHASEAHYPRTSSSFQPLIGELLLSTVAASNLQSFADSDSSAFTLNAVVEPVSEEYAAVTKPITFQPPPVRCCQRTGLLFCKLPEPSICAGWIKRPAQKAALAGTESGPWDGPRSCADGYHSNLKRYYFAEAFDAF